ncbi:MAG: hypothetical protein KBD64_05730 [Gammaproteobacteria bacterium]|nr:hypothetical protein [Gammaproteobacteria bacterium]
MPFQELMDKLSSWIEKNWNKDLKKQSVALTPKSADHPEYKLTPSKNHDYLLLFFIAIPETPYYQWDINLDRCKQYFGIVQFQFFFEQVQHLLQGSELDFVINIQAKEPSEAEKFKFFLKALDLGFFTIYINSELYISYPRERFVIT